MKNNNNDITNMLLEVCIQARAALPDAWHAVDCKVPKEVIGLLNNAISAAENGRGGTNVPLTSWNYSIHGEHIYFPIEDWRSDVASNNTVLGYQEWVEHNLESILSDTDLDGVNAVEVAGCTDQDGIVEVKEETAADFYSVYTHRPGEGVECLCDFNAKPHAIEFAKHLAARTGIRIYGNLCSVEED